MAALNFKKSEKERITHLNTYTDQGVSAWGQTRGQKFINRCNTHLDIWFMSTQQRGARVPTRLKCSLQLSACSFFPIPPGSTFGQAVCQLHNNQSHQVMKQTFSSNTRNKENDHYWADISSFDTIIPIILYIDTFTFDDWWMLEINVPEAAFDCSLRGCIFESDFCVHITYMCLKSWEHNCQPIENRDGSWLVPFSKIANHYIVFLLFLHYNV